MDELGASLVDFALNAGAVGAGIATTETLAGGPPSTDLSYVLKSARSAIVFALPLQQDHIEPYLSKQDHASHDADNARTTNLASGVALQMARYLEMKGFAAGAVAANHVYRKDSENGIFDEHPDLSHRYLAVRSGVGWFGLSGNIIRHDIGAALVLASVVTDAELTPSDPLPVDENYCDSCKLCMASCFSGFMHPVEATEITMGGEAFSYSRRRGHVRCDYVCGGFAGLAPSGDWSTWSPSRCPIPDNEAGFYQALKPAARAYYKRPPAPGGFYNPLLKGRKLEFTCGHCMLVCHPDPDVRKKRHKMLKNSGVVIQEPDGSRRAVSPKEARQYIEAMDLERRAMYEMAD
jgi:epoxyqueuosine reductase